MAWGTSLAGGRKYLIPEVIQTSNMDCGPATLSALLHGWGIPVSYGRLREACQTDVDGTSIDRLEDLARNLGLDAAQVMLPADYFFDAVQKHSAIVVVRTPVGIPHFVVYWRKHGGVVQVMDPVAGRQLRSQSTFAEELFVHTQVVDKDLLLGFFGSESFRWPLSRRLRRLGLDADTIQRLFDAADRRGSWRGWAEIDAAARMVLELVSSAAVQAGREAMHIVLELLDREDPASAIPDPYWSVVVAPSSPGAASDPEQLVLRGAVLVVVYGKAPEEPADKEQRLAQLPSDLRSVLSAPAPRPLRSLLRLLPPSGLGLTGLLAASLLMTAAMQLGLDALFRSMLQLAWYTRQPLHRLSVIAIAIAFVTAAGLASLLVAQQALRLGRYLEIRLRVALFEKLPRLNERYFSSRPVSDMIERAHSLFRLRQLPLLAFDLWRGVCTTALTGAALSYFLPQQGLLILLLTLLGLAVPMGLQLLLVPLDLRARTHAGSLSQSYLDALVGMVALRTHVGERLVVRQHEQRLTAWAGTRLRWVRLQVATQGLQLLLGYGSAAWLISRYLSQGGDAAGLLLVYFWAFGLLASANEFAQLLLQYPEIRNVTLRFLEPLEAPSEAAPSQPSPAALTPVAIELRGVSVIVSGHPVLTEVSVDIPAGMHVAVVGASGAGKSTLIGLLLGLHHAKAGTIRIDGHVVEPAQLLALRGQVAWVDADVRLWNRSLFDNLHNGHAGSRTSQLAQAVATADLGRVIAGLPMGLAQRLGEGGKLVSGGEGQRVRLGRALLQPTPRLVLLDEPFRGLDRDQRQALLTRVRDTWAPATLIFVSHDIESTLSFPKVLVFDHGRIVESGEPQALAAQPGSHYAALLAAERHARRDVWAAAAWQRLSVVDGQLVVDAQPGREKEEGAA
jgi:ATP-binding cassette subfamily B protein